MPTDLLMNGASQVKHHHCTTVRYQIIVYNKNKKAGIRELNAGFLINLLLLEVKISPGHIPPEAERENRGTLVSFYLPVVCSSLQIGIYKQVLFDLVRR